ncbi:MAG: hypothetical protein Q9186_006982, partial [Xanthomendoza sp. 1 TL-2023]
PWLPPPWSTSDDRVRGGSSRSSLSALPNNCALFEGHLDIETLGGAGFASQFQSAVALNHGEVDSTSDSVWDLSAYEGVEIDVGAGDGKVYTLILKDEESQEKRDDGRDKAGINWEAEFRVGESNDANMGEEVKAKKIWVPWSALKATYRGKEKEDAGDFKPAEVRRIGLMMRSFFGTQQGDFRLELRSITARKHTSEAAETAINGRN